MNFGTLPNDLASWMVLIGGLLMAINGGMVVTRLVGQSTKQGLIDPMLRRLFWRTDGAAPALFTSVYAWLSVFMFVFALAGYRLVWTTTHIFGAQSGQVIGGLAWMGMGMAALGLRIALYESGRRQTNNDLNDDGVLT